MAGGGVVVEQGAAAGAEIGWGVLGSGQRQEDTYPFASPTRPPGKSLIAVILKSRFSLDVSHFVAYEFAKRE